MPSLTPRAALEKLGPMQMVDVQVPTTDGRVLILPGCTQPDTDQKLLLSQLTNYVAAWTRETRHPSTRKLAFFSFAR